MHLVLLPLALVLLPIRPVVPAVAADLIFSEFAVVVAPLGEDELTFSVFSTLVVFSLVLGAVGPLLLAPSVLLVLEPISAVHRAVSVHVCSLTVRLVVDPLALVHIAIRVIQLSVPVRPVLAVVALVARAICPLLRAKALPQGAKPLPRVDAAARQRDRASLYFVFPIVILIRSTSTLPGSLALSRVVHYIAGVRFNRQFGPGTSRVVKLASAPAVILMVTSLAGQFSVLVGSAGLINVAHGLPEFALD